MPGERENSLRPLTFLQKGRGASGAGAPQGDPGTEHEEKPLVADARRRDKGERLHPRMGAQSLGKRCEAGRGDLRTLQVSYSRGSGMPTFAKASRRSRQETQVPQGTALSQ